LGHDPNPLIEPLPFSPQGPNSQSNSDQFSEQNKGQTQCFPKRMPLLITQLRRQRTNPDPSAHNDRSSVHNMPETAKHGARFCRLSF
jgi:hypothetical protein